MPLNVSRFLKNVNHEEAWPSNGQASGLVGHLKKGKMGEILVNHPKLAEA